MADEVAVAVLASKYEQMDNKLSRIERDIHEMRKDMKDTYATKEQLSFTEKRLGQIEWIMRWVAISVIAFVFGQVFTKVLELVIK